jgi:hypothetical protein
VPKKIRRPRDADPREGLEKYGKTTFADANNKKYPIDTPCRIKAAWAYIHQPVNASKHTDEEIQIPSRFVFVARRRARNVALPDPDEFVELLARVRKKRK